MAGLQILRDTYRLGASISIEQVSPETGFDPGAEGLCLVVKAAEPGKLAKEAGKLVQAGYFNRTEAKDGKLYLEVPDPDNLPSIAPTIAFDCGVKVTAAFETSGDPYQEVTGIFDIATLQIGYQESEVGA